MSYKSTIENKFLVYLPRVEVRSFKQCKRGVFYSDMSVGQGTVILNTVDQNISKYYERNYTRTLLACKLQNKITLPGHIHLVEITEEKVHMLNCPLNRYGVRGSEDIWGGNCGCLKGNKREFFAHKNHHPGNIQVNNTSGRHHVHKWDPIYQHHLETRQVHDGGTHCQHRSVNTTRID